MAQPEITATDELEINVDDESTENSESVEGEGEEKEVEVKSPTPEEIEEQKERSRLGRKFKSLEDKVESMTSLMQQYLSSSQLPKETDSTTTQLSKVERILADYDPEYPISKKELIETLKGLKEEIKEEDRLNILQRQESDVKYERAYLANLEKLGSDLDEDTHEEVMKLLTTEGSPFNRKYGKGEDPEADCERNFYKALVSLGKATTKKPSPFRGGKPEIAIGVGGDTPPAPKSKAPVKLSRDAQDYINYVKETEGQEAADKLLKRTFG